MEDAHATILNLDNPDDSAAAQCGKGKKGKRSFFAVYDGHGGSTVARFSGDTVHKRLRELDLYKQGQYQQSMTRAFVKTDEDLRANPDYANDSSGCTAVAAMILEDNTIICANAGDSRSIMSIGGEAKPLSYDHKPVNKTENSRIVAAGGFVEFGRVNGNLALSRALGDFEFKQNQNLPAEQQIVTADPDIISHTSTAEDEFLVIACDGIWDVLKNQEVVDFVRRCIAQRKELHEICELMMDKCLAPDSDWGGVGCDNMTVMLVALLNGKTKEEWYDWMVERVEKNVGYTTPQNLPDPFANRGQQGGPGGRQGGPLSGPAQFITNAINSGSLRFDRGQDDEDMDADDQDQYHKSPTHIDDDDSMDETTQTVPSATSSTQSAPINSSAAPEKLSPGIERPEHILSPPSAVMGVKSSPATSSTSTPSSKTSDLPNAGDADKQPHPSVQSDGLMDASESPLKG